MKIIPERLYRRIRYRKGHGVHSPFAYNFITNIIEEKSPYYVFEDIEKKREELLTSKEIVEFVSSKGVAKRKTIAEITGRETQSNKYGALLFRLVNFLQCESILQVGASTGIMTLYLAASCKENQCFILEDREDLVPVIQKQCKSLGLNNVQIKFGEYINTLECLLKQQNTFDLVFLNTARNLDLTKKLLDYHIKTKLLVVDNIRKNNKTKALWKMVTDNPHARITIDLYYLGIAFFDDKFYKKNYKAHFDNGKKQNIYKNRRQRLYFFNWRKKDSQK